MLDIGRAAFDFVEEIERGRTRLVGWRCS